MSRACGLWNVHSVHRGEENADLAKERLILSHKAQKLTALLCLACHLQPSDHLDFTFQAVPL